jgi:hypothetical protein
MNKATVLLMLVLSLMLSACVAFFPGTVRGNGSLAQEARQVQGARGVDLAAPGDLTVQLGEAEGLLIEAEENLLPYIETSLRGGILTIQQPPGVSILPTQPVRYVLTVTSLESLTVSSSGNIAAPVLEADSIEIAIRSSGNITIAGLVCDRLKIEISSSGNLAVEVGAVGEQRIHLRSSGAYEGAEVRSQAAEVEISSSGSATLWVTERLDANISSSGNVVYYGQPEISERTSSSGKLVPRGEK